jgi:hypothetical protein
MNKEQFAIYEKTPQHGKDYNGVILAPFNTKEEAEIAGKKYGYYGDNYYVDILDYNKKSKIINKEQQELLNEAYENYCNNVNLPPTKILPLGTMVVPTLYTQEEFINKCKTDTEFSEKWGLKIEERELSLEERTELAKGKVVPLLGSKDDSYNEAGIPKQSITITYNDKTIESYE